MDVDAVVDAIASAQVPVAKQREGFETVRKLLNNVQTSPEQEKFRQIKKFNEAIQKRLFPQCFDLLRCAGFEDSGELLLYRRDPSTDGELMEVLSVVESLLLSLPEELAAQSKSATASSSAGYAAAKKAPTMPVSKRSVLEQKQEKARAEAKAAAATSQKLPASGNRDGITFLITHDRKLLFGQYKGNEDTDPPHNRLRKEAMIGFERILVGGAITSDYKVKWSSGTCNLGVELKALVNQHFPEDERPDKRALKGPPFLNAEPEIQSIIREQWDAAVQQAPRQAELSLAAMEEIEAAVAGKKDEVVAEIFVKFEGEHGSDKQSIAVLLVDLAKSYEEGNMRDAQKKVKLLQRALNMQRQYGANLREYEITLCELGNAFRDLGDYSMYKEFIEDVLAIEVSMYGWEHGRVAIALTNLGAAFRMLGDHQSEIKLLERALPIMERGLGPEHFEVAKILAKLGDAYGECGKKKKKKDLLERAEPIFLHEYGPEHREMAITWTNLGNAYGELGDNWEKKELLERALAIVKREYGPEHHTVAIPLTNLGVAYGKLGDSTKKKELLERALALTEREYGPEHIELATILFNLGNAYGELGDKAKQRCVLERSYNIYERQYTSEHPRTMNAHRAFLDSWH